MKNHVWSLSWQWDKQAIISVFYLSWALTIMKVMSSVYSQCMHNCQYNSTWPQHDNKVVFPIKQIPATMSRDVTVMLTRFLHEWTYCIHEQPRNELNRHICAFQWKLPKVCWTDSSELRYCIWPIGTITKTCLYNFDPLKPHFYTVKLGFTGVYIIFLIFSQKT